MVEGAERRFAGMDASERLLLEKTIIAGLPGSEETFTVDRFRDAFRHETGAFVHLSEGPGAFYNEPGFAPRDGSAFEDDGYVVTIAWNVRQQRSEVQVFDARDGEFGRGPIARVRLPQRVPNGFHATFVPLAQMQRWGGAA